MPHVYVRLAPVAVAWLLVVCDEEKKERRCQPCTRVCYSARWRLSASCSCPLVCSAARSQPPQRAARPPELPPRPAPASPPGRKRRQSPTPRPKRLPPPPPKLRP